MPYTPDINNPAQPVDTVDRSTAAAEFRTLKGHLVGATVVASAATPNPFAAPANIIDYTGTVTCTGFTAAPLAGMRRTLVCAGAAVFTAGANLRIPGLTAGASLTTVAGQVLELVAITTTLFSLSTTGVVAAQIVGSAPSLTAGAATTSASCSGIAAGNVANDAGGWAIGAIAFAWHGSTGNSVDAGTLYAGSILYFSSSYGGGGNMYLNGPTGPGTWRALSTGNAVSLQNTAATFQRVA